MMFLEKWKPVRDFEGLYEVSNFGRVRSLDRIVKTSRGSRHFHSYMLSQTTTRKGYYSVLLCKDGKQYTKAVHRLVAIAFIPTKDIGLQVNHIDGNKRNNHVDNLEWCTNSYNQIHAYSNGLRQSQKGELNGGHKLTHDDVLEIRQLYETGKTQRELAKMYNVSQMAIYRVVHKITWKHIA